MTKTNRNGRAARIAWFATFAMLAFVLAAPAAADDAQSGEEWWLNTFFRVEGHWQPAGDIQPGWAPRAYDSRAECRERAAFSQAQCERVALRHPALWACSAGVPLEAPPPKPDREVC